MDSSDTNYGMVSLFAILIVIIIVVMMLAPSSESFKHPQTRSDLSSDWDIKSELARLVALQEQILQKISATSP